MIVPVDQSRRQQFAVAIDDRCRLGGFCLMQIGGGADGGDGVAFGQQPGLGKEKGIGSGKQGAVVDQNGIGHGVAHGKGKRACG